MITVKTSSNQFKFKVQGKMIDNIKPVVVNLDHNVQCKINDGVLVIVLSEKPTNMTGLVKVSKEEPSEKEEESKKEKIQRKIKDK